MKTARKIRANFPEAEQLAFERIFADAPGRIFFNSSDHKPRFHKLTIAAALYLAQKYAHKAGLALKLNRDEKKLIKRRFAQMLDLLDE